MKIYIHLELFGLLCVAGINGDVSHIKAIPFGRQTSVRKTFGGYYYDSPTSLATSTTSLPEIIINRGESIDSV